MTILTLLFLSFHVKASELKWNCEKLHLKFVEIPGSNGKEFNREGCWQEKTYYLISSDCKSNPKKCLKSSENKKFNHPGNGIGSPAFIQCYRTGGKPRFLQIQVKNKWIDTSTCFYGSQDSFMDYDTIMSNKE